MYRYDTNWYMIGNKVTIEITDRPKYEKGAVVVDEIRYTDVEGFEVISGDRSAEIEQMIDIDDNHEYLRIYMKDGETATFRNSYAILYNI